MAKPLPEFLRKARQQIIQKMVGGGGPLPGERPHFAGDGFGQDAAAREPGGTAAAAQAPSARNLWGGELVEVDAGGERRHQVLSESVRFFAEEGTRRGALDAISLATGVSITELEAQYGGREGLLWGALEREVDATLADVRSWTRKEVPADLLLAEISERAMRYLEGRPLLLRMLLGQLGEVLGRSPERVRELQARLFSWLAEVVQRGVAEGRFRSDLDPAAIAQGLFAVHLAQYVMSGPGDEASTAQRRKVALALALDGVRSR